MYCATGQPSTNSYTLLYPQMLQVITNISSALKYDVCALIGTADAVRFLRIIDKLTLAFT